MLCAPLFCLGVTVSDFELPHMRNWQSPVLDAFAGACLFHRDATLVDVVSHCRSCLCYLATPYSKVSLNPDGEWDALESRIASVQAARWSRLLALEGVTAVSPIIQAVEMVHADFIEQQLDPLDVHFWESWCRPLLMASGPVIVPPISGWDYSDGIWVEVCAALRVQRPVFLIKPGEEFGGAE